MPTDTVSRRKALRMLAGSAGVGALAPVQLATSRETCGGCGGIDWPVIDIKTSEVPLTFSAGSKRGREAVFRKTTQLTQRKPRAGIGSETSTVIEIANVTECTYTEDTVNNDPALDRYACYQQDWNTITVTHPEYNTKEVRFGFIHDADHVGGFEAKKGGDTGAVPATVTSSALSVAFNALGRMDNLAGTVFSNIAGVTSAAKLAASLYEWYDKYESARYRWNWRIPNHAPTGAKGRACTSSWVKFEVEYDSNISPQFTVEDSTAGFVNGAYHTFDWQL